MTATNHALTGAFIGLAVGNPWVAIPAAFVSHFVCDVIPHYDVPGKTKEERLLSPLFLYVQIYAGAILCGLIVLGLGLFHPLHWLLAAICAFTATTPDLIFMPRFIYAKRTGVDPLNRNWFWRFHNRIQWFQEPVGVLVEVAWTIAVMVLIIPFLR
ncbi:MAG TPA: hypothetical protein VFI84_00745 [Candidatus Saccharimonadales bacterium]|nr:hypothetical protein [Candidatus Saccharimonadales bacterium]